MTLLVFLIFQGGTRVLPWAHSSLKRMFTKQSECLLHRIRKGTLANSSLKGQALFIDSLIFLAWALVLHTLQWQEFYPHTRSWSGALQNRNCQTAQTKLCKHLVTCHGVESGDKQGLLWGSIVALQDWCLNDQISSVIWNLTLSSSSAISLITCTIHSLLFKGFHLYSETAISTV